MAARRSYGTGRLYARIDAGGREHWYGQWWVGDRRLKRSIGPKRTDGSRDGLTRSQPEAELRRLMADVKPAPVAGERLHLAEVGRRYLRHLEAAGRKKSTAASSSPRCVCGSCPSWAIAVSTASTQRTSRTSCAPCAPGESAGSRSATTSAPWARSTATPCILGDGGRA